MICWHDAKRNLPENKHIVLTINEYGELHICEYQVSGDHYYFMLNQTSHQITNVKYWSDLPKRDIIIEKIKNEIII